MKFFIKSEFWIWMKRHVWIHKIWFFCIWIMHLWMQESLIEYEFLVWMILSAWNLIFFSFEGCIYECLKLCKFFWMKMHPWMHEFFLSFWFCSFFFFEKCIYECVKFYNFFWTKMHAWMHELFLPFWYCSLFLKKNAFMNA